VTPVMRTPGCIVVKVVARGIGAIIGGRVSISVSAIPASATAA